MQKWTKEKWENRLVTKYKTNFMLRIPADTPARLSPMTLWIDYSYWMTALLWLPCIIDIQILNSHLLTVQLVSLLGEVSRFFSRGVLLFIVAKETLDSKYVCPLKNVLILLILLMIGEITDLWNNHWYQWRPFLSPLTPMESICEYWTTLERHTEYIRGEDAKY